MQSVESVIASVSIVTIPVNTNTDIGSAISTVSVSVVTGSVKTNASVVSAASERRYQCNQWPVNTIVALLVVSILKLHVPILLFA